MLRVSKGVSKRCACCIYDLIIIVLSGTVLAEGLGGSCSIEPQIVSRVFALTAI